SDWKRLFDGETVSHVLAAVLTKDPDWTQLPANTPAGIRKLLRRCLQRDLRHRLPDIGAARLEIEDAMGGGPAEKVAPQVAPARRPVLPRALFAAAIVTSLALGLIAYRHATEEARVLKLL